MSECFAYPKAHSEILRCAERQVALLLLSGRRLFKVLDVHSEGMIELACWVRVDGPSEVRCFYREVAMVSVKTSNWNGW